MFDQSNLIVFRITGTVKLVDLENIVVVNLTRVKHLNVHKYDIKIGAIRFPSFVYSRSDNFGCSEPDQCFSYSIPELCQHSSSDHNYYALCSNILAPSPFSLNLLASPSKSVISVN